MRRLRFRGKSPRAAVSVARWIYPFLAVVLFFPALAIWVGVVRICRSLPFNGAVIYPLLAGAGAYALLHFLFSKPMTAYVFGHELTHACAAMLSGYKVKSLYVSGKGGEVELSGSNVFVALAPYSVPIYTMAILLLYSLVKRYAVFSVPPLWVGFGVGGTLVFHLALTLHSLREDQPDLRHAGAFFSLVWIVLSNGVASLLVVKALYPSVNLPNCFGGWIADTRILLDRSWEGLVWMIRLGRSWVRV